MQELALLSVADRHIFALCTLNMAYAITIVTTWSVRRALPYLARHGALRMIHDCMFIARWGT